MGRVAGSQEGQGRKANVREVPVGRKPTICFDSSIASNPEISRENASREAGCVESRQLALAT